MKTLVFTLVWLIVLLVGLGSARQAEAHSMYQSAVLLDFHTGTVEVRLELPPSRLEKAFGQSLRPETFDSVRWKLESYVLQRLHADTEGQAWTIRFSHPMRWETVGGAEYIIADLDLIPPGQTSARRFNLEDDVITDTLSNHVVLVSVRSDWSTSTFANDPELLGILNGAERSISINRDQGDWEKGFRSVFHLGTRHIAEGTDHLLFLLALLLPAPLLRVGERWNGFAGVRHGLTKILQVVTAFTLGHSVTLALAAFGMVHVPANLIEVLIAVSILVSAIHAFRPMFPGKEAVIAASFGLIHGLAFASTLAELGLHRWERVASILAFNLGIEAMQLLVVLCVMPSLMILSQTRFYPLFRLIGAAFAALAAAGWIVERSFHVELHVDAAVNVLAQHSVWFTVSLFFVAVNLFALTRMNRSRK